MNKKILAFLLMMLPAVLMTSCLKNQEDTFDKSASIRSAEYLDNVRRVLASSENGWVLNYFPDRNQSYGGFSYVLVFDEQNVTAYFVNGDVETELVSSETVEKPVPETVTYSLTNEDGPVISFDTYSKYLHYYATPTGSSGAGGYEAYDGDFIFIVLNISEDENTITLKGNRSGNIIYLYRNNIAPEEYISECRMLKDNLLYELYDSEAAHLEIDLETQQAVIAVGDETAEQAFVVTNEGIKLYNPVTVGGLTFDSFTYDYDKTSFVMDNEQSVELVGTLPEGWRSYEDLAGRYRIGLDPSGPVVTIVANGDGESYTIRNIESYVSNSNVTAYYKYTKGSFVISPQYIGRYSSYYAWLIAVSDDAITWDTSLQLKGTNSSTDPLTITFSAGEFTTFMTYAFRDDPPTADGRAGYFTQFDAPFTLVRVN